MRIIIVAADVSQPPVGEEIIETAEPLTPEEEKALGLAPSTPESMPVVPALPPPPKPKVPAKPRAEMLDAQGLVDLSREYVRAALERKEDLKNMIGEQILELPYSGDSTLGDEISYTLRRKLKGRGRDPGEIVPLSVVWEALKSKINTTRKVMESGKTIDEALQEMTITPGYFFTSIDTMIAQIGQTEKGAIAKVEYEAKPLISYFARAIAKQVDPDLLNMPAWVAADIQRKREVFKDNIDPDTGEPIIDIKTGKYTNPAHAPMYTPDGKMIPGQTRLTIAYNKLWDEADRILFRDGPAGVIRKQIEEQVAQAVKEAQFEENSKAAAEGRQPAQIDRPNPDQIERLNKFAAKACDHKCASQMWTQALGIKAPWKPGSCTYLFMVSPEGQVMLHRPSSTSGKARFMTDKIVELLAKTAPEAARKYQVMETQKKGRLYLLPVDPNSLLWIKGGMLVGKQTPKTSWDVWRLQLESQGKQGQEVVAPETDGEEMLAPEDANETIEPKIRNIPMTPEGIEDVPEQRRTKPQNLQQIWSLTGQDMDEFEQKVKGRVPLIVNQNTIRTAVGKIVDDLYSDASPSLAPQGRDPMFVAQRDRFTKRVLRQAALLYMERMSGGKLEKQLERDIMGDLAKRNAPQLLAFRHIDPEEYHLDDDPAPQTLMAAIQLEMITDLMKYLSNDQNYVKLQQMFGRKAAELLMQMVKKAMFVSTSRLVAYGA